MSAIDATALKAELKAWEKQFKADNNGREPSKSDIKACPEIAEKYRIYSKTRASSSSSSSRAVAPPPSIAPKTPSKKTAAAVHNDIFKTPSRQSAQGKSTATATDFAFAPSPSRLRALAASRSFSGSPNRSASKSTRVYEETIPVNLGKSIFVPPSPSTSRLAADTPRTKAKKWLDGEDVSPFKKRPATHSLEQPSVKAHASNSAPETAASSARPSVPASKAGFWQQLDEARTAIKNAKDTQKVKELDPEQDIQEEHDEDDVLAPSPVKPVKGKGKAKQMQMLDDFEEEASQPTALLTQPAHRNGGSRLSPGPQVNGKAASAVPPQPSKFFASSSLSAPVAESLRRSRSPSSAPPEAAEAARPKSKSQPKTKKRTSTAAALKPFDTLTETADDQAGEDAERETAADGKLTAEAIKLLADQKREQAIVEAMRKKDAPTETAAKQRPARRIKKVKVDDAALLEEREGQANVEDNPFQAGAPEVEMVAEEDEDDYEIRDLSDEYDDERTRRRSRSLSLATHDDTFDEAEALDSSIDPHLVSLLSLRASPVKNRLKKLHQKRDETVSRLLHEPTYLIREKREREAKGLEDLEDEDGLAEDEAEYTRVDEAGHDGKEENSDDDWASEPEGWKDLGDGEMDGLDW